MTLGAQYRLEFTNVSLETDMESEVTTPTISVSKLSYDSTMESHGHLVTRYQNRDSRKNSLDLGCIQEKCSRLDSEFM